MTSRIHIGTSGWHYAHWRGVFYPSELSTSKWFDHYASRFDNVELNNSFYRLPKRDTFEAWAARAPQAFSFSVKASRYITHLKKLNMDRQGLEKFFEAIDGLGKHLGPVLFQLPPRWRVNLDRFEHFLNELPSGYRYTFEFRDPSWHSANVLSLLERHGFAFCIYDLAGFTTELHRTADFVYVRLHGPGAKYEGLYDQATLQRWASRCRRWQADGADVFVYFDNDQSGYAAINAAELGELISRTGPSKPRRATAQHGSERRSAWPTLARSSGT